MGLFNNKGVQYLHRLRYQIDHANPKVKRDFYTKQNYRAEIISECLLVFLMAVLITFFIFLMLSTWMLWIKIFLSIGMLFILLILILLICACGYDIHLMNLYKRIRGLSTKK